MDTEERPTSSRSFDEVYKDLCTKSNPVQVKFRAAYEIVSFQTAEAAKALIKAFNDEPKSDLLRHEYCFCMGQFDPSNKAVIDVLEPFLNRVVNDKTSSSIVIHETVEALGNISESNLVELLSKFKDDETN